MIPTLHDLRPTLATHITLLLLLHLVRTVCITHRSAPQFDAISTKEYWMLDLQCTKSCWASFSAVNVVITSSFSSDRSSLWYDVPLHDWTNLTFAFQSLTLCHNSHSGSLLQYQRWWIFHFQYLLVTIWKTSLSHSSLFSGKRTPAAAGLTLTWSQMVWWFRWQRKWG